jgi:hypothetical protein
MALGAGALVVTTIVQYRNARDSQAVLRQVARLLGGRHDANGALGVLHGVGVRFARIIRRGGRHKERWTEVEVALPYGHPLAIHVRRRGWLGKAGLRPDPVVELPLGDLEFDREFLVEAVPEDIARRLLDAEVRGFLGAHRRVELDTLRVGDLDVLRFATHGWIADPATAIRALETLAGIGVHLRDAYAMVAGVAPYPPPLDASPGRVAFAVRGAEVAAFEAERARLRLRRKVIAGVVLTAAAITIVVLSFLSEK